MQTRWSKIVAAVLAVVAGAGCTTAQRKTTPFYKTTAPSSAMAAKAAEGKSEGERAVDRVNVWPLAYWNRPVGSVLWPILTFSEDHFALFPLYSQFRQDGEGGKWDEFNVLWPLAQFDTKAKDYRVFPVYWGKDRKGKGYQAVFPLYWNGDGYNALLPLWLKTRHTFTTPLFGWGTNGYWSVPVLLSGGSHPKEGTYSLGVGLGLLGWLEHSEPGFYEWGVLLSMVGGGVTKDWATKDSGEGVRRTASWVFPVYDLKRAHAVREDGTKELTQSHFSSLLGVLAAYDWHAAAGASNPEEGEFSTLVWLWNWKWVGGTNVYWRVFPLAGRERDADFAERWGWMNGERLPEGLRPIEPGRRAVLRAQAEELRAEKKSVWAETGQKRLRMGTNWVEVAELPGYEWSRKDERWWLLALAGREAYVDGHWEDGQGRRARWDGEAEAERYVVEGTREWGNILVAKGRTERKATFDAVSGAKIGDERRSSGHVLGLLYRWSGKEGVEGEEDWARRRVLWKLWDWERRGKDISLDIFPGVTWDSKADGYRKVSWLWRLFRWERDAQGRTSVDVLFIPVWRGSASMVDGQTSEAEAQGAEVAE